jgi:hypothetical protein
VSGTFQQEFEGYGFDGPCDRESCPDPVTCTGTYPDGRTERLCSRHRAEDVQVSNLKTLTQQKAERDQLQSIAIILHVSTDVNPNGSYYASVANPINSCPVGFGATPYRALRELGLRIADNADRVLQSIVEHEMELRVAAQPGVRDE